MTRAFTGSFGTIAAINGLCLLSSGCGWAAWFIWPQTPEWWGFGVVSIFLGVAAVSAFAKAVRAIVKLYARARAVADFEALGAPLKSSAMASRRALIDAGMLDDDA